jgi:septal ring factor EnvC (AmiA/AmiB activator)
MRRTLKRAKSKKQQGRARNLKRVKEVKGSGKIEHAVEHHETAVTEDAKELEKLREEVTQIKSDIAHILEALQTLETWVPMSRAEIQQYAWAYRKFVDITTHLREEARFR